MNEVLGRLVDFIITSNYAHAIIILLGFLIGARILLYLFQHVIEKLAKKSKNPAGDKIVVKMETPLVVIMVLVGVQLSARRILENGLLFENLLNTVMVVILTLMSIGITNIIITFWAKNRQNQDNEEFHQEVQPLVKSLSKLLLAAVGIVVILQMWGVQVGTTLASLGVIGVILGFAFQDTMKNIFGGISLIIDDSIHKKDVIRLETGETGEVVEVNLRSTKIKTFDNEYLIIPNGVLSNTKIINLAEPTPTLRIDILVSVAYGSDPAYVKEVLLSVLREEELVLKFPKREIRFVKMGEYSLDFMILFFISDYRKKFLMEDAITTAAYNALREANIQVPFPSRTVYTGKDVKWQTKPVASLTNTIPKVNNSVVKKKVTKKSSKKSTKKSTRSKK